MKANRLSSSEKTFACETCSMRKKAEANPKTLMARLWRWHTGWHVYQAHLAAQRSADLTACSCCKTADSP
jgi:hypothetical protein